jgi:hypothetical protein
MIKSFKLWSVAAGLFAATLVTSPDVANAACGSESASVQNSGSYDANYKTCYNPSSDGRNGRVWATTFVNLKGWRNAYARRSGVCTTSIQIWLKTYEYNFATGANRTRTDYRQTSTCVATPTLTNSGDWYITAATCQICN